MTNTNDRAPKILDIPIGLDATGMRLEFDSLGKVEVPGRTGTGARRPSAAWNTSTSATTGCRKRCTTPTGT